MSREVLLIGDSNVRRFYSKLGNQVKNLDFVQARSTEELAIALQSVQVTYKFVIFAFITNLIITAGEEGCQPQTRLNAITELFSTTIPLLG